MKIGKVEKSRDGWNLRKGGDLRKKKNTSTQSILTNMLRVLKDS